MRYLLHNLSCNFSFIGCPNNASGNTFKGKMQRVSGKKGKPHFAKKYLRRSQKQIIYLQMYLMPKLVVSSSPMEYQI